MLHPFQARPPQAGYSTSSGYLGTACVHGFPSLLVFQIPIYRTVAWMHNPTPPLCKGRCRRRRRRGCVSMHTILWGALHNPTQSPSQMPKFGICQPPLHKGAVGAAHPSNSPINRNLLSYFIPLICPCQPPFFAMDKKRRMCYDKQKTGRGSYEKSCCVFTGPLYAGSCGLR